MFPRRGGVLAFLAGVGAIGAVRAQEPPRPAPVPVDTSVPVDSLRTSFLPSADVRIFTNGNTNVVGEKSSAVGVGLGISLPLIWVKRLSTWSVTYNTGAQLYGQDENDANDLHHNYSASYSRTASRRLSFGFDLSGNRSKQQGFDTSRPDQVATLVPRTDVIRASGGFHASLAMGTSGYLAMGLNGGLNRYGDLGSGEVTPAEDLDGDLILDPGEDLDGDGVLDPGSAAVAFVDSIFFGGNVSWGRVISARTSVGIGYGYGQFVYDEPAGLTPSAFPARDTSVHTLFVNSSRRFSQFSSGSLHLGVLVGQQEGSEDRVEPSLSASMSRKVSEQSSLSFGLSQRAGSGSGNGIASLDRGLFVSWGWGRPRMGASVALSFWDRETLMDPLGGQEERTTTFQIAESFSWMLSQWLSLGVSHSYRDQQADDPTLEASGYHSVGGFVGLSIRRRSARAG